MKIAIEAADPALESGFKGEHQLSQIKSEEESKHKVQIPTSNTPIPQSNAPASVDHRATQPNSIVIKDDDDDDDLVIVSAALVSRVQSTGTPAQAQVPVVPGQHEDQAKRERKKAILERRLEQLKIEQELLEMEE